MPPKFLPCLPGLRWAQRAASIKRNDWTGNVLVCRGSRGLSGDQRIHENRMTDLQPESSVSYVATVYNKKSFLEQVLGAIEAEWQETGGEIILVDDGSTDGSLELLNDFKGGRDNIVVHTGPNRGPAAATNIGFNGASCRYLRFVDGDDIICRGSTQKLMAALRAHDVGFAYGKHCYADEAEP